MGGWYGEMGLDTMISVPLFGFLVMFIYRTIASCPCMQRDGHLSPQARENKAAVFRASTGFLGFMVFVSLISILTQAGLTGLAAHSDANYCAMCTGVGNDEYLVTNTAVTKCREGMAGCHTNDWAPRTKPDGEMDPVWPPELLANASAVCARVSEFADWATPGHGDYKPDRLLFPGNASGSVPNPNYDPDLQFRCPHYNPTLDCETSQPPFL